MPKFFLLLIAKNNKEKCTRKIIYIYIYIKLYVHLFILHYFCWISCCPHGDQSSGVWHRVFWFTDKTFRMNLPPPSSGHNLEFQCRQGYILAYFLCTMDVLRRQWHVKGRHWFQRDCLKIRYRKQESPIDYSKKNACTASIKKTFRRQ